MKPVYTHNTVGIKFKNTNTFGIVRILVESPITIKLRPRWGHFYKYPADASIHPLAHSMTGAFSTYTYDNSNRYKTNVLTRRLLILILFSHLQLHIHLKHRFISVLHIGWRYFFTICIQQIRILFIQMIRPRFKIYSYLLIPKPLIIKDI